LLTSRFDIVLCGGARQFKALRRLLPKVAPFGTVHLVSSYLEPDQVEALAPWTDVLHEPHHDPDGYQNFRLFCIRDLNWVGSAPYFVKIDTDVHLADDWFDYVEECIARRPRAVLVGTDRGSNPIDYDISGPLVRHRLGRDVRVRNRPKVGGSFYVADATFFREHDATMQHLHDLIYAFKDGSRIRPSHIGKDPEAEPVGPGLVDMRGVCALRAGKASEDNLRSLTVHFVGASRRMAVLPPGSRVVVPAKLDGPYGWKRVKKRWKQWKRRWSGEAWRSSKKPEGYY
jgi:hypothetical protein